MSTRAEDLAVAPMTEALSPASPAETAAYEGFPEPVFVLDAAGRIAHWTRRAARFSGWSCDAVIGTEPAEHLFDAASAVALREAIALRLKREPRSAEAFADRLYVQMQRSGGDTLPVELVLTEVGTGGSRHFMVVVRRATTASSEDGSPAGLLQLFAGLLEQLPSAVVVADGDCRIRLVNNAFCQRFGLTTEPVSLHGTDCHALFARIADAFADPQELLGRLEGLAAAGHAGSGLAFELRDGSAVSLEYAAVTTPMGDRHLWMFHDAGEHQTMRRALASNNRLLERVGTALSHFVGGGDTRRLFEALLEDALSLTQSEYGFIGRVLYDADDAPYLKTYALTNIAWDEETRELFARHHAQGMEFRNLETLFGRVMSTEEPVIANDPAGDPRSGGLPQGHPPLESFLGLPLRVGPRLVGMLGVANRSGGYQPELIDFLQPFLSACANIIAAERAEQMRSENERRLAALSNVMLSLGPDYQLNVERLTAAAGQLLGAQRAWYRGASRDAERLEMVAAWPEPAPGADAAAAEAPPLEDLFEELGGHDHPRVLRQTAGSRAGELEPELSGIPAGTLIAQGVEAGGAARGILNLAYPSEVRPEETDLELVRIVGSAIATEEARLAGAEALLASEQRYADLYRSLDAVFTLSPDGFLSIGHDDRVVMASPGFSDLTGMKAEEVAGKELTILDEMFRERADRALPFAGLEDVIGQLRGDDGAGDTSVETLHLRFPRVCVLRRLVRIADPADGEVKAIVCLRDVTAETEVDRMKSEFLSTAAHELRTPMASVYGFSELLLTREYDSETAKELLQTIHGQSGRLIEMLNELLDLARIEARAGKDFDMQPGPIGPLLATAVREVVLTGVDRKVSLVAPEDLPEVRFDRDKMLQVFTNVLSNAVKYSQAGSEIRVRAGRRRSMQHGWLTVAVEDQGVGMTRQQSARMFERFYRADPSGNVPGSGLGMSLVKEIVDIHGGRVEVESEPGRGTTVTVLLPAGGQMPSPDRAG